MACHGPTSWPVIGKMNIYSELSLFLGKQIQWKKKLFGKTNKFSEKIIWGEICWPYKALFWCHFFCIFEHLFRQLRGVLHQNFWHFLKIYECHIDYIPLFWPFLHRGPVQLTIHFTLTQKIVELQAIICSSFSPVFVLFSHIIDRYDVQGYQVCLGCS